MSAHWISTKLPEQLRKKHGPKPQCPWNKPKRKKVRAELARPRSGYSQRVNLKIINEQVHRTYAHFVPSPYMTFPTYLTVNITNLIVEDLWTKPKEVAKFLKLDEDTWHGCYGDAD